MEARRHERTLFLLAMLTLLIASIPAQGYAGMGDATVYALCYHSFLGTKRHAGDVGLTELASQLDTLSSHGYRFVTLEDMASGRISGRLNVLVTIDDGNASVKDAFRNVFKPRGIRPLLCIYPAVIGKRSYSLTWGEIASLAQEGCEVAAHGYYHLVLNERLFETDPDAFSREIAASKRMLEERLHTRIRVFAYPSGVHGPHAEKAVRDAGYRYAFTIRWGPIRVPADLAGSPLRLPRYMIYSGNWPVVVGAIRNDALPSGRQRMHASTLRP